MEVHIHASSGIFTHGPSVRADENITTSDRMAIAICPYSSVPEGHAIASWLLHYAISRKVEGWRPDEAKEF
jgi:hypothetical protein